MQREAGTEAGGDTWQWADKPSGNGWAAVRWVRVLTVCRGRRALRFPALPQSTPGPNSDLSSGGRIRAAPGRKGLHESEVSAFLLLDYCKTNYNLQF